MEKKRKIKNMLALLGVLLPVLLTAQQVSVKAEVSRKEIKIGEQVRFTFNVSHDDKTTVAWPSIRDKIGTAFDVVSFKDPDTVFSEDKKKITFTQEYILTSFDSGYQVIPAFRFTYKKGNDTLEIFTDSIGVTVNSVPVDTTQTFYDIAGPEDAPFNFREILPHVLAVIGIVVIGLAVFFIVRRYRAKRKAKVKVEVIPEAPVIPAHVIAYEKLSELEQKKLWQNAKTKEYYIELTDIIRQYIHNRFLVDASEMTTDEILDRMRITDAAPDAIAKLGQMLRLADLVKFAKAQPVAAEHEMAMSYGREFVDLTKKETGTSQPTDKKP